MRNFKAHAKFSAVFAIMLGATGCPHQLKINVSNETGNDLYVASESLRISVANGKSIVVPDYGNKLDRSADGWKLLKIDQGGITRCYVVDFLSIGVSKTHLGEGRVQLANVFLTKDDAYVIPRNSSANQYVNAGTLNKQPRMKKC